ncbi:iron-containing redox enzyme family protein [Streptomyces actuosus]|uniref:Iron-containing redox enzyme family protein n=1 Tax=Streptomyces actuosus TaxID=1885 RepID=A0ABS2W126_STRAS|nr:iron-containing redox enzyme family protein [Streptomyces actuosus]MBN0049113.1 iron-containing redox enzyme family protein [Streptomyces actuosus]
MQTQEAAASTAPSARHGTDGPPAPPQGADHARTVYAYAADPEASVHPGGHLHEIRAALRRHAPAGAGGSPEALVRTATAWANGEHERYRRLLPADGGEASEGSPEGRREVLVRRAVLSCAPLSLVSGAWLQWLSAPGNADDPVVLRILALYASDVGVGHPEASRGSAYLELMRRLRLAENAVPTARLTTDRRIAEAAFYLPALLLAMSRRPDDCRGEILGADLCLRAVGLLPALTMVREALPTAADWTAVDPSRPRGAEEPPVERCRATVDELVAREGERAGLAVRAGFGWTLATLRAWSSALHTELVAAGDPAFDMAELMRLRAREGSVYHHGFMLEGRPLATWLAECRTDPAPLLDALAGSRLVKPGRSGASSLVRGLVGERGPMFRVFSPEDLTVIRRWIDSLPERPDAPRGTTASRTAGSTEVPKAVKGAEDAESTETTGTAADEAAAEGGRRGPSAAARGAVGRAGSAGTSGTGSHTPSDTAAGTDSVAVASGSPALPPGSLSRDTGRVLASVAAGLRAGPSAAGRAPSNLREAYHLLMRRTDTPALRSWAMEYVAGWLARSRHGMSRGAGPLPECWGREGLRPWLQAQHDRHGAEFAENAAVPLPPRAAVVDDTVQTAPLTLIDGSWLQGFTDHELASSAVGHSLFETYWDELGNGEPRLNHPLIYREVLKEMDVDLPPTDSVEFARWSGFRDESFELPVYWLCVGRFPQTFLPEVLGLNLAMELSGVGGTYRRARLALKEYGFSTRFVDIHNTIDNVATGHSAWAADAVDTLLASLPEAPGPGNRAETWERVRVGYRSLNPPSGVGARLKARRGRLTGRRR